MFVIIINGYKFSDLFAGIGTLIERFFDNGRRCFRSYS